MRGSDRSIKPVLVTVLGYLLVLVCLIGLLVHENTPVDQRFSLHAESIAMAGGQLTLRGDNLKAGLKGVVVDSLVDDRALVWSQLEGKPVKALDVGPNGIALFSCYGSKVISIDLSELSNPKLLGSIELPNSVDVIRIIGDRAVIGLERTAGLCVIDLQDPHNMRLVSHYPQRATVTSITSVYDIVYFTLADGEIAKLDLSVADPVPEKLFSLRAPWRISQQDDRLAIGTIKGVVYLYNLSAERMLTGVGQLAFSEGVRGVLFLDDSLIVVLADGTMNLYNLAEWPNPRRTASLTLPGSPLLLERITDRNCVVVSLIAGGLALVDVQGTVLKQRAHLKVPKTYQALKNQAGLLLAAGYQGVDAYSIGEIRVGEYPTPIEQATITGEYRRLLAWNGHVYGYAEQRLEDFGRAEAVGRRPSSPYLAVADDGGATLYRRSEDGGTPGVGSLVLDGGVIDCLIHNDLLYVAGRKVLNIFAWNVPGKLSPVAELQVPDEIISIATLDAGLLLLLTRLDGVLVLDVSDPRHPLQVASLLPPGHLHNSGKARDVLVDGRRTYVSRGDGGVYVYDLGVPSRPQLLQVVDTPGRARNMALHGGLLLVADGTEGVFMIDVTDEHAVVPIGTIPTPLVAEQLAVTEDALIVSSHPGGTMRLPLPQVVDVDVVSGEELRLGLDKAVYGQLLFVYDQRDSVSVKLEAPE